MYKLNTIDCGGYTSRNNQLIFSLYNTDFSNVAALDGLTLNVTLDESPVAQFSGYELVSMAIDGESIQARFMRKLDDSTAEAINALETNLNYLKTATEASVMSLANATSPIPSILMRQNLSDTEALDYISVYPEWVVGFNYKKNWIIRYNDELYRIGQDHTSQEQWVPGADGTTALYSKIEITESGYEVWQEWDGVSGSYANGQIVQDPTDEKLYKSLIDNNVWGPPSKQPSYWDLYEA